MAIKNIDTLDGWDFEHESGDQITPEEMELFQKPPPEPDERDYSQIQPTGSEWAKAQFLTGPLTSLWRAQARGQYSDAGLVDRFLSPKGIDIPLFGASVEKPDLMSAADANEAWAPKGETWFDKPISSGLAQELAKEKRENIERDSNLDRYSNAHGWALNLGANIAGTMLDPLNVGAMFVPGIGEEAIAARLGGGVVARMAGRAASGAIGGAAASVPIVAAHVGLDGDMSLRDAFYDLAISAAGGAIIQGLGEGGLRELGVLKPDQLMRAAAATGQTASQTHAAITAALGQLITEKPIDVVPIVHPPATDLQIRNVQIYLKANGIKNVPEEIIQRAAAIARTGEDIDVALAEARKVSIPQTFADLAAQQKSLNEIGSVPGMSTKELIRAKGEVDAAAAAKSDTSGSESATASPTRAPASKASPAVESRAGVGESRVKASPDSAKLAPEEVDRILALPEVQEAIKHPREIDRTHDVPYLAGSNNEGGITFIDRRVPVELNIDGKVFDPAGPLNVHEQVEHALMAKGKMPYESAHRIALVEERKAVEALGVNWNHYQAEMEKLVGTTEHEDVKAPPSDLYTKPYPHQEAEFLRRETGVPEVPQEHLLDPEVIAAQTELANAQLKSEAFAQAAQCLVEAGI